MVETRRRWSDEERRQAVDETQSLPVSAVARKRGIAKSLLFRWRKEAGLRGKRRKDASFVPVRIASADSSTASLALWLVALSVPLGGLIAARYGRERVLIASPIPSSL